MIQERAHLSINLLEGPVFRLAVKAIVADGPSGGDVIFPVRTTTSECNTGVVAAI